MHEKMWHYNGDAYGLSLRDHLVVFYYIIASEIWLDKRVGFDVSGLLRVGTTVYK